MHKIYNFLLFLFAEFIRAKIGLLSGFSLMSLLSSINIVSLGWFFAILSANEKQKKIWNWNGSSLVNSVISDER